MRREGNHESCGNQLRARKRLGIVDGEQQMPDWVAPEFQSAWRQLQQRRERQRIQQLRQRQRQR